MKRWLSALAIVAMLALAGVWFHHQFERVEEEVTTGFTGEAARNPFLAATLLLERYDVDSESRRGFAPTEWLPPAADTLVVPLAGRLTEPETIAVVSDWASRGGHLIVLAPPYRTEASDALLAGFGVGAFDIDTDDDGDDGDAASAVDDSDTPSYTADLDDLDYRLETAADDGLLYELSDDEGLFVVRRLYDSGIVSVVADNNYFVNRKLNRHDHGLLLLLTLAEDIDPGKVWFFYSANTDNLGALLIQHAPYAVATALLLLALWMWSVMPRFGPRQSLAPVERRSILEHMEAAGRFRWRNGAAESMLQATVDAVVDRATRAHPGHRARDATAAADIVSRLTGRDPAAVAAALTTTGATRARDFVDRLRLLQAIRKDL